MRIKEISLACALIFCAGSAVAADYSTGNLGAGSVFSGDSSVAATTTFSDNWLFSLSGSPTSFLGFVFSPSNIGSINSFSATLTDPNGVSTNWDILGFTLPSGLAVQGGAYENVLGAGDYVLNVSGESTTATSYSIVLAAAPVPEPESYAMILAGLGLIGFMARRRG